MNKQIGKQDRNRAGVSGCHYRVLVQDFYDSFPQKKLTRPLTRKLTRKERTSTILCNIIYSFMFCGTSVEG